MSNDLMEIDVRARSITLEKRAHAASSDLLLAVLNDLRSWFAIDFDLFDASGELMCRAPDERRVDWGLRGQICSELAGRGEARLIAEEVPVAVLAIPVPLSRDACVVAAGTFLIRPVGVSDSLDQAYPVLGLRGEAAKAWASQQRVWPIDLLEKFAQLAISKLESDLEARQLQAEVEQLSLHLSTTYEEISLLYHLTQNLKLSSTDEQLGQMALEWLAEVLPVESLAIQFVPIDDRGSVTGDGRMAPVLIKSGSCPVDCAQFSELVQHAAADDPQRPLIINRTGPIDIAWPFPEIRQLILVPLSEGDNVFGWLAAFNHCSGEELGSVEASLLSSVGAILGIHSGNTELYRQQREFLAGVVRALTSAIDAKDPYTCGHSDRVARVSVRIAKELGCDPDQLNTIYLSGLLHDVGKIGIDDNVLRKPGKLTELEYEHIKLHAEIGHKILRDLKQLDEVLPVVLHHHEQWDGKGYPHNLSGDDIPLLARIVAVADSFDAMGSDRPYRKGMAEEMLDKIMREGSGKQWDPGIVDAFFRARKDIRELAVRERHNLALDVQQWL